MADRHRDPENGQAWGDVPPQGPGGGAGPNGGGYHGRNVGPGYGQNYGPNYGQNYGPNYDANHGAGYDAAYGYGPGGPGGDGSGWSHGSSGPRRSSALPYVAVAVIAVLLAAVAVLGVVLWRNSSGQDATTASGPSTSTQYVTATDDAGAGDSAVQGAHSQTPAQSTAAPVRPAQPAGASQCSDLGAGLFARSGAGSGATSCPFADAVRNAYAASGANGSPRTVSASSPVTGQTYSMSCVPSGTNVVVCTGGNDAVVYVY